MKLYPIGTIIVLKNDPQELMITSRFPLYKNQANELGYFDYGACLYPQGQLSEQAENIERGRY